MVGKQVAEYPLPRPPLAKAPKNPIDKSTIVSIYPKAIVERKPTIQPGLFEIPAGSMDNPGILVVGTSSWWSYSGDYRPTIEVPNSSVQIADSIIGDFCRGMLECNMEDARPGLFFVPGEYTPVEIKISEKLKDVFKDVNAKQRNWFMRLVKIADSLWARSNGNPLAIPDESRMAAEQLNLKDKPWMMDYQTVQLVPCFACGSLKNATFPVCATCKAVDPNYKGEIKFAGQ